MRYKCWTIDVLKSSQLTVLHCFCFFVIQLTVEEPYYCGFVEPFSSIWILRLVVHLVFFVQCWWVWGAWVVSSNCGSWFLVSSCKLYSAFSLFRLFLIVDVGTRIALSIPVEEGQVICRLAASFLCSCAVLYFSPSTESGALWLNIFYVTEYILC